MLSRIIALLKDYRLDYLDFHARDNLQAFKEMIEEEGLTLNEEQINYINYCENHIKNICPHIVYMTINGIENIPVKFTTKFGDMP